MVSFKEQCIILRKRDKSIIEIMKITGRPKTSVYPYIKNLPLSEARVQKYRVASGKRIRKFALARKGKSVRTFQTFEKWTPELVLLVGHLVFDGEILKARCSYNNRSEALIERVERSMKRLYNYPPVRRINPLTGVTRISYYNVALSNYLKRKAHQLLKRAHCLPIRMKREIVRAFFDDEGCMDFRPITNRRRIRGYQKDISILKLMQSLLQDFGISARLEQPNELVIIGKQQLICFEKEINFSSGVYVNGNRTNSRWKKHLEKKQLLRKAIESFKT